MLAAAVLTLCTFRIFGGGVTVCVTNRRSGRAHGVTSRVVNRRRPATGDWRRPYFIDYVAFVVFGRHGWGVGIGAAAIQLGARARA